MHDSETIQIGEINVQLVSQPDEFVEEIPHEVLNEGTVIPVDPLQTIADRVLEHSSDSGSKSKFIYRLNQVKFESVTSLPLSSALGLACSQLSLVSRIKFS